MKRNTLPPIIARQLARSRRILRQAGLWPRRTQLPKPQAVPQSKKKSAAKAASPQQENWRRLAAFMESEKNDLPRVKKLWNSIRSNPRAYKGSEIIFITGNQKRDQIILQNLEWLEASNTRQKTLEREAQKLEEIQRLLKQSPYGKKIQATLHQLNRRLAGILTKKMHYTQQARGLLLSHLFPRLIGTEAVPFDRFGVRYRVQKPKPVR